jgi:hypothetical protein
LHNILLEAQRSLYIPILNGNELDIFGCRVR